MHPGLEAWARIHIKRAAAVSGISEVVPPRTIVEPIPPASPDGECALRDCHEPSLGGKEDLCTEHLRNLLSWTEHAKRAGCEK